MIPQSQITAQVLRSLLLWPGAKKIWEWVEDGSTTLVPGMVCSLKIGAYHFEQLLGGLGVECPRMLVGIHQMSSDVLLDNLCHQPGHGSACPCDEMHDLIATGLAVEGAFDSLDLSPDSANPGEELGFLTDRV